MRRENDLVDDSVNVQLRAQKAAARVETNGRLQSVGHAAQPPIPSWFDRLFPQEHLIVGGREVKGLVLPTWAAGVLLAAILGSGGFMFSKLSDQRDMLIEMRTELRLAKEHEIEYREEFKTRLNVNDLQIQNMTSEMRAIRAILTPQQMRATEQRSRKSDN